MWIKGLTWLMEDTLQAATPCRLRGENPLLTGEVRALGPREQGRDSWASAPEPACRSPPQAWPHFRLLLSHQVAAEAVLLSGPEP